MTRLLSPKESHVVTTTRRGVKCYHQRPFVASNGTQGNRQHKWYLQKSLMNKKAAVCRAEDSSESSGTTQAKREEKISGVPEKWQPPAEEEEKTSIQKFLYPEPEDLPDDFSMPIWDHLDELRERVIVAALAAGTAVLTCFAFSKDLVVFLEAPVASQGVRFLQLSPGEFFFTTLKVAGYSGLLISVPTILYEIVAYVVPGLTRSERQLLAPIVFGSSILFYVGLLFSYEILSPAALNFFVSYAEGAVESLWSIDQYFEFILVLMLSTGLAFQVEAKVHEYLQVPVIQVLLGQTGLVTSKQMLDQWRFVVVGATLAAAVLTPSTDPFTQTLLAVPLIGLYLGGAAFVKLIEARKAQAQATA